MKTVDEVIDKLIECHTRWCRWSETSDIVERSAVENAIIYLKEYRDKAHSLDIDIADHHRSFEQLGIEIERYQEAVKNCEEAENNYKKLCMQFEFFRQDYEALKVRQAEQQANPPLTWDELKTMKGDPVWVEYNLHLSEKAQALSKGWFVISSFEPFGKAEMIVMTNHFVFTDYEQNAEWRAYRNEKAGINE